MDFGLLFINRVIVHDIPRRRINVDDGSSPILSDAESPMDKSLNTFFTGKMRQAASASNAFQVQFDLEATSPVPHAVEDFLGPTEEDSFIETSQLMARHLYQSQTGVNSGGLLTVADCKLGPVAAIGILKLEREEGVRVEQRILEGRRLFDLQRVQDLMLTQKTKLFKLALFFQNDHGIEGIVCDHQSGYRPTTEVANFFLLRFLGCALVEAPQVTTKRFYYETEKFINELNALAEIKVVYLHHLATEMTNQDPTIVPEQFARRYLQPEHRDDYLTRLREHRLFGSFQKDIALIKSKVQKQIYEFECGVSIVGKPEILSEKVRVRQTAQGLTEATVTDRLQRVGSR